MNKKYILILFYLMGFSMLSFSQETEKISASFLFNYYEQDGIHSAVEGGKGTQRLESFDNKLLVNIPIKKGTVSAMGAVDYYTSASTLNVDKYVTSASTGTSEVSGKETRYYFNLAYLANLEKDQKLGLKIGLSSEFDVLSFQVGTNYQKNLANKNALIKIGFNASFDRIKEVFPGELRESILSNYGVPDGTYTNNNSNYGGSSGGSSGGSGSGSGGNSGGGSGVSGGGSGSESGGSGSGSGGGSGGSDSGSGSSGKKEGQLASNSGSSGSNYNTEKAFDYTFNRRYTYSLNLRYDQNITKRLKSNFWSDITLQHGLLSIPFNRVYFNDFELDETKKLVKVEKLPSYRVKFGIAGQLNYFVHEMLIPKIYSRVYIDSWGIIASSTSVEAVFRPFNFLSVTPFYRFHIQQGAKYFEVYGLHKPKSEYYSSDYDLSSLNTHKFGLSLSIHPLEGMFPIKIKKKKQQKIGFIGIKSFNIRLAHYVRSDQLRANSFSVGITVAEF